MADEQTKQDGKAPEDSAPRGGGPPHPSAGDHAHPSGWRVSPSPDGRGMPPSKPPNMGSIVRRFGIVLILLLGLNIWLSTLVPTSNPRVRIPYSPNFLQQVEQGNVKSISSQGSTIQGDFKDKVRYPNQKSVATTRFDTEVPSFANHNQLSALLQSKGVVENAKSVTGSGSTFGNVLLAFGPTLLLVGVFVYLARRTASQGGGGLMGFGRSQAKRFEGSSQRVTFDDVAGIDEAKEELTEIVDFLKNPDRYRRLGARIPRGALLSGPPGTGKTLLARAVAGEANVPFFSMSASEFVEIVVGVGASRVRDLFAQAKEAAPAIIFIDELDAIGRSRASSIGLSGGNDEREQTLNQILTEMDGFDPNVGVIVLAATNRPEILDPALLRPGRFDRRVQVQPPDRDGRRKILEVHTRSVPLAPDVDLAALASTTQGMVGADLANLVNEAALLGAHRNHDRVRMEDFTDAVEKLILGTERRIVITPADRERTAYHEGGHAIVGMLTPEADPVRKVSIIPRGPALGVTLSAPDADRFNYDREYMLARIRVALGGRAAEEIVYGNITTGAESDIKQLTEIARQMVGKWGMSDAIGPVTVIPDDGQGPFLPGTSATSEQTQQLVDAEVRRIVDDSHAHVTDLLTENRDKLDSLVHALLEQETLDSEAAYAAAGVDQPGEQAGPRVETVVHRSID